MRLSPAVVLALVVLLVASSAGAVTATSATEPTQPSPHANAHTSVADVESPLEPDDPRQVIRIQVSANGDARWMIESRYVLEDDEDVERFEAYAEAVDGGDRDADLDGGYDATLFQDALERAESSTDREMALEDEGWTDPRIESPDDEEAEYEIGVIAYSFTWSNFAAVDQNRLHLGDVFWDDGETWFPTLSDDQRLVIEPPEDYGFQNPPIGTQNGALVWDGPYVFDEDELEVTFLEGAGSTVPSSGVDLSTLAIGLLALLVVGIGGYLLAKRDLPTTLFGSDDDREREADADAETELEYDDEATPSAVDESRVAGEGVSADPDAGEETASPSQEIDVELLSDEERVRRLLQQNGGRMKQAMIVKETGWSNAKVSQLLSKMDDNDEIDKLRIGRENLITLPEVDPTELE